jgi:sugar/nucleoside kinase (ribokinase family)
MDSMNLWIDIAQPSLRKVIASVDCLILNDEEFEQLTGKPLVPACHEVLTWGPSAVVAKQGKYGAVLVTQDGFFAIPAYPIADVIDPTGAGDSFAGGFVGYVAARLRAGDEVTHELLSTAMAYGTSLASYNVQAFGTERMPQLTAAEVQQRVDDLQRMTAFDADPVTLRA